MSIVEVPQPNANVSVLSKGVGKVLDLKVFRFHKNIIAWNLIYLRIPLVLETQYCVVCALLLDS